MFWVDRSTLVVWSWASPHATTQRFLPYCRKYTDFASVVSKSESYFEKIFSIFFSQIATELLALWLFPELVLSVVLKLCTIWSILAFFSGNWFKIKKVFSFHD